MEISLEQAVRIGRDLKALMQSDAVHIALEVMKQDYQQRVFNSEPSDVATREQAYYESRGLDGLVATINSFIHLAEAEIEPETNEDDNTY
jgi:gamma-glutamyltranspeptidase